MPNLTPCWRWIALAAALALTAPAFAQTTPPAAPPPLGLVDHPCPPDSVGRSPALLAVAKAMAADGPLDMSALMKTYGPVLADMMKSQAAHAKVDWPDLCLYSADDAALIQSGGAKVVFLGDSITEFWGVADPALFTHGVVDRGISGQTSGQALLRVYADVVALHPKVVHILIGTNDIAQNTGPTRPDDLKNNIRAMVDIAKANRIQVILASITPVTTMPGQKDAHPAAQILEMNRWLKALANSQGLVFVDYYAALVGANGGMRDGMSRDGLHPLASGYAVMKPLAMAAVEKALQAGQ
jgi:lysophospholipase L1-like esterase